MLSAEKILRSILIPFFLASLSPFSPDYSICIAFCEYSKSVQVQNRASSLHSFLTMYVIAHLLYLIFINLFRSLIQLLHIWQSSYDYSFLLPVTKLNFFYKTFFDSHVIRVLLYIYVVFLCLALFSLSIQYYSSTIMSVSSSLLKYRYRFFFVLFSFLSFDSVLFVNTYEYIICRWNICTSFSLRLFDIPTFSTSTNRQCAATVRLCSRSWNGEVMAVHLALRRGEQWQSIQALISIPRNLHLFVSGSSVRILLCIFFFASSY